MQNTVFSLIRLTQAARNQLYPIRNFSALYNLSRELSIATTPTKGGGSLINTEIRSGSRIGNYWRGVAGKVNPRKAPVRPASEKRDREAGGSRKGER